MWSGASAARGREAGSETPEWLVGLDRPDEPGELAGAGDDDLLLWFAAAGHPVPALVEALLAAPGALDHDDVLASLAAGELVADVGRRRACQADSTSSRRTWLLPTLVIDPCRRRSPELCSDGTRPTKAINSSALRKRLKSPISATRASAVRVSTPRRQRSRPTSSRQAPARPCRGSRARAPDPRVDEVDRVQVAIEGDLLGRMLEALLAKPAATGHVHALVGSSLPWRRQNFDSRWRSRIRSRRASSRARTRSRAASSSGEGT